MDSSLEELYLCIVHLNGRNYNNFHKNFPLLTFNVCDNNVMGLQTKCSYSMFIHKVQQVVKSQYVL